jgi:hypothetical protein
VTPRRILTSLVAVAVSLSLASCALLPVSQPVAPVATPSAAAPDAGDAQEPAPSNAESRVVVLSDDDVTDVVKFTRSEPAGSWPVGPGTPPGFPAGVPLYSDRWVDKSVGEFTTSAGLPAYYVTFWGGYAELDKLSVRFLELGYEMDQQQDDTKRAIVYENDRYRVTITATESAVDPQTQEAIDPAYDYTIVVLD